MKAELARRQTCADKLEALLKSQPLVWIPIRELAAVGGIGGWRTRLSELANRADDPLQIEHNGHNGLSSCHRYVPRPRDPLGPDASSQRELRLPL